jgi:hypothetical protein
MNFKGKVFSKTTDKYNNSVQAGTLFDIIP